MKKVSLYITLFSTTVIAFSCNKILETSPKESIDLGIATKSKDAIKASIISIYASMRGTGYYGRDYIVQNEVLADNGEITSANSNRFVNESNNQVRAQVGIWNTCYINIFRCNFIMKYIDGIKGFSAEEKEQLLGEAHFLRAYNYFDLVRSYARNPRFTYDFDHGVPIVLDAVLDVNDPNFAGSPARAKIAEVYTQIVKDLDSAALKLGRAENAGIAIPQIAPFRASKLAAIALNSRVKLYNGDWAGAEASATEALNLLPFNSAKLKVEFVSDSATYMSKWGNLHPEMIFGLSFEAYEALGTDAIQYIYYKHPVLGGYGDITTRKELLDDYYTNDPRKKSLLKADVKSNQAVNYCLKWPGAKPFRGGDDIMLLRVSEVYLNRAEARAMQAGKETLAMDDLNKVHTRTNLPAIAPLTGDALVSEVLRERRIELAFEGHRLFDLLRTGRNIVKGSTTIENKDYKVVAPIPVAETDVNKNLLQNPQY